MTKISCAAAVPQIITFAPRTTIPSGRRLTMRRYMSGSACFDGPWRRLPLGSVSAPDERDVALLRRHQPRLQALVVVGAERLVHVPRRRPHGVERRPARAAPARAGARPLEHQALHPAVGDHVVHRPDHRQVARHAPAGQVRRGRHQLLVLRVARGLEDLRVPLDRPAGDRVVDRVRHQAPALVQIRPQLPERRLELLGRLGVAGLRDLRRQALAGPQVVEERRQHVAEVADDAVVGHREDGRPARRC